MNHMNVHRLHITYSLHDELKFSFLSFPSFHIHHPFRYVLRSFPSWDLKRQRSKMKTAPSSPMSRAEMVTGGDNEFSMFQSSPMDAQKFMNILILT